MLLEPGANSNNPAPTIPETYQEVNDDRHFKIDMEVENGMMHNPRNTNIEILINNCRMRKLENSPDK